MKAFVSYTLARFRREYMENVWRSYVTDALFYIAENTAKQSGGRYLQKRYADIVEHKEEARTADEIKEHFIKALGGENL